MLELNTKDLESRKKVKIDGHIYTVRPAGAGDDMKMNKVLGELKELSEKSTDKGESAKDILKVASLQEKALRIVTERYDDGGNGNKAFNLISNMSAAERYKLEEQIFDLIPLESIASLETLEKIEEDNGNAR